MTTRGSVLVPPYAQIIADAVQILSRHRCEAVIVVGTQLTAVETGAALEAHLSVPLLLALFVPDALNPFIGGAALLSETRVLRAGVPIVRAPELEWRGMLARELGAVVVHVRAEDGHVWLADVDGIGVQVNPADLGPRLGIGHPP